LSRFSFIPLFSVGGSGGVLRLKQIWRGGKCSVAVPPYTLYLSLTATPLFLLVVVAIGLEYNAAHGSLWGSALDACIRVAGC